MKRSNYSKGLRLYAAFYLNGRFDVTHDDVNYVAFHSIRGYVLQKFVGLELVDAHKPFVLLHELIRYCSRIFSSEDVSRSYPDSFVKSLIEHSTFSLFAKYFVE